MSSSDLDVVDLEKLSADELDHLPFGVIRVDMAGVIVAYNAAESRLSGLSPRQVVGRNFFTEVAPCAGMPSFYARFINGMERGSFSFRLEYTFHFERAPVRVAIRVERPEGKQTAWIRVHRIATLEDPIAREVREFIEARSLGQAEAADPTLAQNCADEQIRAPAAIQPHGGLIALDGETGEVAAWSENIGDFLSDLAIRRGATLQEVFPELAESLALPPVESAHDGVPFFLGHVHRAAEACDVRVHRSGRLFLIELEHSLNRSPSPAALLTNHSSRIELDRAESIRTLASLAARAAQAISGFDRTLLYRFLEDGTGVALGEHRANERFAPFLDLHFPESDIPAQARALYLESPLRHTPDNNYHPIPIVSGDSAAPTIDLGGCELRSTSPFHRAYHRNMRVQSSFSASLTLDGRLWGLLIGHHARPRHLPATLRHALSQLARDAEYNLLRLSEIEHREPAEHRALRQTLARRSLEDDMQSPGELLEGAPGLGDLFGASGVVVLEGEHARGRGVLPPRAVLARIRAHLAARPSPLYMTHHLAGDLPELAPYASTTAGVLALSLGTDADVCVLWIRGEHPEEITWGGRPSKESLDLDGRRVLLPRRSFERWVDLRRGFAEAWPPWTRRAALELRELVLTALAHHARASLHRTFQQWQLNRARTTYLATMSHELRTPLSAILGIIETMDTGAIPTRARSDLALVKSAADDLNHVIDDVLDYARLEVGDSHGHLQIEANDLDRVLQRTVDLLIPRATKSGLSLRFDAAGELPLLELDSRRVSQIVGQLVLNAVKFTDSGEIRVSRRILPGERLRIEVVDTGIGLEGVEVEALFEAFSRAGLRKHSEHRPGSGLGLAVARALVTAMGGEIGAYGNAEVGSTFWIELPARTVRASPPEEPPDELPPPRSLDLRVLLADDNGVNRLVMTRMIEEQGWTVTAVASGEAAVERAASQAYDVILLDLHMPGCDGPEALAKIRGAQGPSARTAALLVTANVDVVSRGDPEIADFADVLTKPVGTEELRDAILSVVGPELGPDPGSE